MKFVLQFVMLSMIAGAGQAQRAFTILAEKRSSALPGGATVGASAKASARIRRGPLETRVENGLGFIGGMNAGLLKTFSAAWQSAGDGTLDEERAVLIFRMGDGIYTGRLTPPCRGFRQTSFPWDTRALAIVHTHPNRVDPMPSEHDGMVARKYAVPIFTITSRGMFVYNPLTLKTTKVLDGIEWLYLSKWTPQIYSRLNLTVEAPEK